MINFLINQAIEEIEKEILPEIKIKNFEVIKVYRKRNYLGFYENGSCFDTPIIKLNMPGIEKESKAVNLPLYDIILTTIMHELAHSLQQLKKDFKGWFDEDEAESFAYDYWCYGIINEI